MSEPISSPAARAQDRAQRPLCVAILAMGGQGGGVLTDWVVELAESAGWEAQSTSVPGVAQRTGATIYYVEMMKPEGGRTPIFALMPTPGDVDVVLAAEFMEAGRAVIRGLVTPDRTTFIASTHRAFTVTEKQTPGDGIADPQAVLTAADVAAKRQILFDMNEMAVKHGTVISSSMFGALAGSGSLPFTREAFENAIRKNGKGVEASLAAFAEAYERAKNRAVDPVAKRPAQAERAIPAAVGNGKLGALLQRLHDRFPDYVKPMAFAGLEKVVDFQDARYGDEYLDRLGALYVLDENAGGAAHSHAFTNEAAKYVANAMCYDDVVRVADLKTRSSRFGRIASEVGVSDNQLISFTEFMHPRIEEVAGVLPVSVTKWIEARPRLYKWLDRRINRGRRVKTKTIFWFVALYSVAGLRGLRRISSRHKSETEHMHSWLSAATEKLSDNYGYAVEILKCRRLVKGYSDTHARGLSKFDRVLSAARLVADREDGGDWVRRLREAALQDEEGEELEGMIKTVESFAVQRLAAQ